MIESETYFLQQLTGLKTGYIKFSNEGKITEINQYLSELLGYSSSNALRGTDLLSDFFSANSSDEPFRKQLKHSSNVNPIETKLRRADGGFVTVLINLVPCIEEKGKLFFEAIVMDITRIRIKDEISGHVATIRASSILARRVAHDISNKLTAVLGYAELAMMKISSDDKISGYIETVRKSAQKTLDDINELKRIYSIPDNNPEVIDIFETAKTFAARQSDEMDSSITFETALGESRDIKILADLRSVKLALSEVVNNAVDAMQDGGTILLGLKMQDVDSGSLFRSIVPGKYVIITITDTGEGIPENIQSKIFEPFFSTRKTSIVNGFGLPLVEMITYLNLGTITFESSPGKGSAFHLLFPVHSED